MCKSAKTECVKPLSDREIRLRPVSQAPGEARRFVRQHAAELGFPNSADDATLIVSELVTNAIQAAPDCPAWVSVRAAGRYLILEVRDCSPKPPEFKPVDYMAEDGRGLRIVDQLAAFFDWTPLPGGKVMWAILD
jgi:anti-sigma regulatory factor (Ser/Thr protein kinase)